MNSGCPGCGLANYEGLCPHCRGDQAAYEDELVPPFPTSVPPVTLWMPVSDELYDALLDLVDEGGPA